MTTIPTARKVAPGSELAGLLDEAAVGPVLLERDGEFFQIRHLDSDPESIWAGYDAEKARRTIHESTGRWADQDSESMIADLYRAREEGSRTIDRP